MTRTYWFTTPGTSEYQPGPKSSNRCPALVIDLIHKTFWKVQWKRPLAKEFLTLNSVGQPTVPTKGVKWYQSERKPGYTATDDRRPDIWVHESAIELSDNVMEK